MSYADEIERLLSLRDRGAISEEEFQQLKAKVMQHDTRTAFDGGSSSASELPFVSNVMSVRRSRTDSWLGGVCGGIAKTTRIASWFWRLAFVLMMLCAGSGLLLYVLLWIFIPKE